MLKEVCVENFTLVPKAVQKGADRIELCDNLTVGGTTVSLGVMEQAVRYCEPHSVPVMAIIRPRGGDFVYGSIEKAIMLKDVQFAKNAGVDGIVIGALTAENKLDKPFLTEVLSECAQMDTTFHMAFDSMASSDQKEAIDWLSEAGFKRILTHGGAKEDPIEKYIERLKELIDYAAGRIVIMPGGGVSEQNAEALQQALGIKEVHGTKIVGEL